MSQSNLYDTTRTAWEDIWDSASVEVELQTAEYRRARQLRDMYLPYLNKTDLILEAGSGLGAVLIPMLHMGYNVVGLDYAVNALQTSQAHTPDLPLVAGDVHDLPFPDNSLGAYLSFGVLEHFPHGMGAALAEAYRVLKPTGILILTIPYPNIVWRLAQRKRELAGKTRIDEDFYESTYTRQQLMTEVADVGFDVVRALPTSHSFTLWSTHPIFRADGYYRTSRLAEVGGDVIRLIAPWIFNYMTLVIGRK